MADEATLWGTQPTSGPDPSTPPTPSTRTRSAGFAVPPAMVPDLVRAIRTAGGLSQEALACHLDVSISTVSGWENGKHEPQLRNLRRLEQLYRTLTAEHPAPEQEHRTRLTA